MSSRKALTQQISPRLPPLLKVPLDIDPRGGFVGQDEIQAAFELLAQSEDALKRGFEEVAAKRGISLADLLLLAAFKVRVMLSHVRMKRNRWRKQDETLRALTGESMLSLYLAIDDPSPQKKARRNPFIAFRDDSEEPDAMLEADEPDEQIKRVATLYDPKVGKAFQLMSNGKLLPAAAYEPGDNGFVHAHWHGDRKDDIFHVYDLEIPNCCLKDGTIKQTEPPPVAQASEEETEPKADGQQQSGADEGDEKQSEDEITTKDANEPAEAETTTKDTNEPAKGKAKKRQKQTQRQ